MKFNGAQRASASRSSSRIEEENAQIGNGLTAHDVSLNRKDTYRQWNDENYWMKQIFNVLFVSEWMNEWNIYKKGREGKEEKKSRAQIELEC